MILVFIYIIISFGDWCKTISFGKVNSYVHRSIKRKNKLITTILQCHLKNTLSLFICHIVLIGQLPWGLSKMFCLLGWLAILNSKFSWLMDVGRLSIGYGIGVLYYVVPVYIAEIQPQNLHGAFTTVNQLSLKAIYQLLP
ncbi:unnamed protein product [Lactuca saligna]|uniref:Major facilitator superfamily (MFS) profile domain-containing protein n=1 Tax=Lactuca saligna TaxID=75948 RepID=A0AA35Y7C3_LACSI|nr:unnamed protein product [Lactuca saligna]